MKAKDEAQSHKRMWHSYWQQAMVAPYTLHFLLKSIKNQSNCVSISSYMMPSVFGSTDGPLPWAAA